MIEDIKKAIDTYRGLSPLGKRFFREDVGLTSLKARTTRRKTMRKTTTRTKRTAETPAATGAVE